MALADETAHVAKEKVQSCQSRDRYDPRAGDGHDRIYPGKVIEPARVGGDSGGVRRGLEVWSPAPNPINRSYGEDEMFSQVNDYSSRPPGRTNISQEIGSGFFIWSAAA
jgi:hypothetical protein